MGPVHCITKTLFVVPRLLSFVVVFVGRDSIFWRKALGHLYNFNSYSDAFW